MKVRFGEWTLDADTRTLYQGADDVHVSTKAFDLLKLLIEARPRVLTKGELQEALWPGVFVSEASLFTLVSEIRTAIRDEARRPQFVRTVHGVGYSFRGDATETATLHAGTRVTPIACVLVWEGRLFPLTEGEHIVGRDMDVAVTLESTTVSRRHARLRLSAGAASIEDLGSKNGTFVNDVAVTAETALADGDRVRIGSLLLTFRCGGSAFSTETQRVDRDAGQR